MSGAPPKDKTTETAEPEFESPKSLGFFRGLFRGTRNGRNGDSNLRETIEELFEQQILVHELASPRVSWKQWTASGAAVEPDSDGQCSR